MEVPDHPISGHCVDDFYCWACYYSPFLLACDPHQNQTSLAMYLQPGLGKEVGREVWVLQRLEKCPRMAVGIEG